MLTLHQAEQGSRLKTRAGYDIEIHPGGRTCTIFIEGRAESPKDQFGQRSTDQSIPRIFFVGDIFELNLESDLLHLIGNKNFRITIPYRYLPALEFNQLKLRCTSVSDQFPVYIFYKRSIREIYSLLSRKQKNQFVILGPDNPKIDLITLNVKFPNVRVLILHPTVSDTAEQNDNSRFQTDVRAADLVRSGGAEELTGDPVFLARIHLRNLDLEAARDLIVQYDLTLDEVQFIRTFLTAMIRNERNDKDLIAAKDELISIDEMYRLAGILMRDEKQVFDAELDRGVKPKAAGFLIPVVTKLRKKTKNKDDEIYLWECEYRLGQMKG